MEATSRQQRHNLTKQAILKAARALVLEKGPENLSLREVARRVKHSPAGLYEYFSSKDELIAAVAAEALERLNFYLRRISTKLSVEHRLVEIGLAYVDFARQNPEHFLLVFTRLPSTRTSIQQSPSAASPYAVVLQTVQAGITDGTIKAGFAAEEMAYGLWSLVHGMAMLQQTHLQSFQANFLEGDRRVLEVFVKGLLAK